MGTADDVVRRYPWSHGWSIDSINNQLIHSIIYDQNMVINDGYLVANPELLNSLKNLNTSLLGNVLLSGTASLFCRSNPKDLAEGILKNKENLETFKRALEGENEKLLVRRLGTLQKYANQNLIQWPKDKNTGAIFAAFLERLNSNNSLKLSLPYDDSRRDFDLVYRSFTDAMDKNFREARQEWERICWRELGQINIDEHDPFDLELRKKPCYGRVRTLMQVANEAYHVAYSSAMAWSVREEGVSSSPLTAFCPAYIDLFEKSVIDEKEDNLRYEGIGSVLISANLLRFGRESNFSWVRELVLNDEFVEVRQQYLSLLNGYMNWQGDLSDVRKYADQYRKLLAKVVSDHIPTYSDIAESFFNFFGGSQIASALQSIDSLVSQVGISTPMNLDPVKCVKNIVEPREVEILLERPGLESSWYGTTESLARELGLINARLDSTKLKDILDPIKPFDPNG